MEEPNHTPARRWSRRTWWALLAFGSAVIVLGLVAFLLVGSSKPSVRAACRDYVHAVNEPDEALAGDAVRRLAEWRPGGDEPRNDVEWIGWFAYTVKWQFMLSGGFPEGSWFATALYFECGEKYWSPNDHTTESP